MRKKLVILFGVLLVLLLATTVASAHGLNADKLKRAGWFCFNAGPDNWTHCVKQWGSENTEQVMVFSEDGHTFKGTELLVLADEEDGPYNGQPCPQDNLDHYHPVPDSPYVACHHFDTGRN